MGECGLTPREAAEVSLEEFTQRRDGKEKEMRAKWELARWCKWQDALLSPNIKPERKPTTPQAFVRFAWDEVAEEVRKEDCYINEETLEWLNRIKDKHYNKIS